MKEPLYTFWKDIEDNSCFVNSFYRYKSILQFLYAIEIKAPQVTEDLKAIADNFYQLSKDDEKFKRTIAKTNDEIKRTIKFVKLNKENIDSFSRKDNNLLYNSLIEHIITLNFIEYTLSIDKSKQQHIFDMLKKWSKKYNLDKYKANIPKINYELVALNSIFKKQTIIDNYWNELSAESLYEIEVPNTILKKRTNRNYISLSSGLSINYDSLYKKSLTPFVFIPFNVKNLIQLWKFPFWAITNINLDSILNDSNELDAYIKYLDNLFRILLLSSADLYKSYGNDEMTLFTCWDPTKEKWSTYSDKIDKLYNEYKSIYKEQVKTNFEFSGYESVKEKVEDEHFVWFVEYQINGISKGKLAKTYNVTESNVISAIDDISELVGLEKRKPSTGGRPKKLNQETDKILVQ